MLGLGRISAGFGRMGAGGGGGYTFVNPAAAALVARISSTPDAAWKAAYDAVYSVSGFATALAKLDQLVISAGPDAQASKLDWCANRSVTANGVMYYIPREGSHSDGTTGWEDSGVLHSAGGNLAQNSASAFVYIFMEGAGLADQGQLLGLNSASDRFRLKGNATDAAAFRINGATSVGLSNAAAHTSLFTMVRRGATDSEFYRNTTSLGTSAVASAALVAANVAYHKNNTTFAAVSVIEAAKGFGGALDITDITAIKNGIEAFLTAAAATAEEADFGTAAISSSTTIPDGQESTTGKGFTCTGLDKLPSGQWVVGNFGRKTDSDPAVNMPAIVVLSADFTTKIAEFDLSLITLTDAPQGVCYDPVNDSVWYKMPSQTVIRQINYTTGAALSSITDGHIGNALAYDSLLDCLIIGNSTTVEWRDKATGVLIKYAVIPNAADHFWFDPSKGEAGHLWCQYGSNGVDASIDIWDIAAREVVDTLTIPGAQSPEGIHVAGDVFTIADDGWHHGTAATNTVKQYALS